MKKQTFKAFVTLALYLLAVPGIFFISALVLGSLINWTSFERIPPDECEESVFARNILQKTLENDYEYVKQCLAPEDAERFTPEKFSETVDDFPGGELKNTEFIAAFVYRFNDGARSFKFHFDCRFEDGWALAEVKVFRDSQEMMTTGGRIFIRRASASQREINRLTLSGKSPRHFVVLLWFLLVPLFVVGTVIVCLRTPIPRRKWLWILIILFIGVVKITFNWTSGHYSSFYFLTVHFLSVSATTASPHSPWHVSLSFPFGAIWFWVMRRGFLKNAAADALAETIVEENG